MLTPRVGHGATEVSDMPDARTTDELKTDTQLRAQLTELEERLVDEYRSVAADTVRRHVRDEREHFADARVQVFVPILVERAVRARLAGT